MSELTDYLPEALETFGPIAVRKMFGGYGIYRDGLMFALVAGDTLYLKADAENVRYFDALNLPPFEYRRNGKLAKMMYYQAPEEFMEDREQAAVWALRSYDAALRASAGKLKSTRRSASRASNE